MAVMIHLILQEFRQLGLSFHTNKLIPVFFSLFPQEIKVFDVRHIHMEGYTLLLKNRKKSNFLLSPALLPAVQCS